MIKRIDLFAATVLAIGGIGFLASPTMAQQTDQQQQQQQPAAQPSAGAQQPQAGESTPGQPTVAKPAAGEQNANQMEQAQASQALADAVSAALSGDASKLSDQFAQNDQSKIKEIKFDDIKQPIDQLKEAYKDKYQKDLDVSQNVAEVFNQEFAQVGGAGEQARQASAHIGAEAGAAQPGNAGAQQPSNAGATEGQKEAGTAAQGAQVAAQGAQATAQIPVMVTIPARHGMPEAKLDLVRQDSALKLQLPATAETQQIQQKLQQQIQSCVQVKDQWPSDATDAQRAIAHSILLAFGTESTTATPAAGSSTETPGAGQSATPAPPSPEQHNQ